MCLLLLNKMFNFCLFACFVIFLILLFFINDKNVFDLFKAEIFTLAAQLQVLVCTLSEVGAWAEGQPHFEGVNSIFLKQFWLPWDMAHSFKLYGANLSLNVFFILSSHGPGKHFEMPQIWMVLLK